MLRPTSLTLRPMITSLALMALAGCVGMHAHESSVDHPSTVEIAPLPQPAVARRAFGMVQATQNFAQTVLVDPFVRPWSTASAVGSVMLKTGGGTLRRTMTNKLQFPQPGDPVPPAGNSTPMDLQAWEKHLDRLLGSSASNGNIQLLIDGDEFFPRLKQVIAKAEEHIDIRTYIFDNDDVSVAIADQLRGRSADVDVRVLLDGVGTLLGTQVDSQDMPADFDTPLSMTSYFEKGSDVRVRTHSNPLMTGDHVKSTIIDGELAFVGGMNIGREYRHEWHDMMVEVTGPVVREIQREYDKAWAKAGFFGDLGLLVQSLKPHRRAKHAEGYPVRVLQTLPHDSQIYRAQLTAIRHARKYIFIENAYFSDDVILYELAAARHRGVDVRIIIPNRGNHPMLNLSNSTTINTMLEHGIRVFLFPGMSHVKAAVFDGWACLGSANFDKMSLRINREMNLATSDPAAVAEVLARLFATDFDASVEVTSPVSTTWRHNLAELVADVVL